MCLFNSTPTPGKTRFQNVTLISPSHCILNVIQELLSNHHNFPSILLFAGKEQSTHNKYSGEILFLSYLEDTLIHSILLFWRTKYSDTIHQQYYHGVWHHLFFMLVFSVFDGYFCFKTLRLNSQSCFKKQQKLSHDKIGLYKIAKNLKALHLQGCFLSLFSF